MITFREYLDQCFLLPSLRNLWPLVSEIYKSLGFTDDISDEIRIDEYFYIYQQFKKYVSSIKGKVYLYIGSPSEALKCVNKLLDDSTESAETRKQVVYNFLRDDYLLNLSNGIELYIQQLVDFEEGLDDGE